MGLPVTLAPLLLALVQKWSNADSYKYNAHTAGEPALPDPTLYQLSAEYVPPTIGTTDWDKWSFWYGAESQSLKDNGECTVNGAEPTLDPTWHGCKNQANHGSMFFADKTLATSTEWGLAQAVGVVVGKDEEPVNSLRLAMRQATLPLSQANSVISPNPQAEARRRKLTGGDRRKLQSTPGITPSPPPSSPFAPVAAYPSPPYPPPMKYTTTAVGVRVTTLETFNLTQPGLFVLDATHVPSGCSLWPVSPPPLPTLLSGPSLARCPLTPRSALACQSDAPDRVSYPAPTPPPPPPWSPRT